MKKFFEKIVKGRYPLLGLLILAFFYSFVNFSFNQAQAINTLTNYVPAVNIFVKDENGESSGYLVKQTTVQNILNDYGYTLGDEDYTEPALDSIVEEGQTIQINRVTYSTSYTTEDIPFTTEFVTRSGNVKTTRTAQTGKVGTLKKTYTTKLINGVEVSTDLTNEEVIEEPTNTVIEYNAIAEGATWTGRLTTYGYDCAGCGGGTSAGAKLSSNGVNGSGSAKITYHGKQYYVLAADRSIPFCTIIEIKNSGFGIGDTAYGIVLDRGSSITGNSIDIFNGSERGGKKYFNGGANYATTFTIISVGRGNAYCFND